MGSGSDGGRAPREVAPADRAAAGGFARGSDPGPARYAGGQRVVVGGCGLGWGTALEPYDLNGGLRPPSTVGQCPSRQIGRCPRWRSVVASSTTWVCGGARLCVAVALLLRALGLGWVPTLPAVDAMAATPMFWVYGRLGAGFSVVTGFAALFAHLRRIERPCPGCWPPPAGWPDSPYWCRGLPFLEDCFTGSGCGVGTDSTGSAGGCWRDGGAAPSFSESGSSVPVAAQIFSSERSSASPPSIRLDS